MVWENPRRQGGTNRRWLGRDITGTIDEYRTTPRWINIVKHYESDGITPELMIQGIRTDKDSDCYETRGSESVTLTGDINLIYAAPDHLQCNYEKGQGTINGNTGG